MYFFIRVSYQGDTVAEVRGDRELINSPATMTAIWRALWACAAAGDGVNIQMGGSEPLWVSSATDALKIRTEHLYPTFGKGINPSPWWRELRS